MPEMSHRERSFSAVSGYPKDSGFGGHWSGCARNNRKNAKCSCGMDAVIGRVGKAFAAVAAEARAAGYERGVREAAGRTFRFSVKSRRVPPSEISDAILALLDPEPGRGEGK